MHVMQSACRRTDPRLFDSTNYRDHLEARKICAGCPSVQLCILGAVDIANEISTDLPAFRGPDGTWGGLLWINGHICDGAVA
jgi:hypothetical protein